MAFNQVGDFWLAPGQSTRVHIALGGLVNEAEWGGCTMDYGRRRRDQSGAAHGQPAHQREEAHSLASRFAKPHRLFGDRDEHRGGIGPFYDSRRGQRIDVPKEVASESQTDHACVDR